MKHKENNIAMRGFGWSFVDNILSLIVKFIVGIILARILSPEDFGLIGLITVFITISTTFVDGGLTQALISKKKVEQIDYDTMFIFNLCSAFFFYLILYFIAPYIAVFFKQNALTLILRVLGLVLFINALFLVNKTILTKAIDFKSQSIASILAAIVSGFVGIMLAIQGFGAWSLVFMNIINQLVILMVLCYINPWVPRFNFSIRSLRDQLSFGVNILLAGLIFRVFTNIYYLAIGRLYGAGVLGQYSRADQFNMLCSSNITSVVERVSYPLLSRENISDNERVELFRKTLINVASISIPIIFTLFAVSTPLIHVLIGEKWAMSAKLLKILCFVGLFNPLINLNMSLLKVYNKTRVFLFFEIFRYVILSIPNLIIGLFCGLDLMLWAYALSSFISYIIVIFITKVFSKFKPLDQIKSIVKILLVALPITIIQYIIEQVIDNMVFVLLLQIITGLILYYTLYSKMKFDIVQRLNKLLKR